MTTYVGETFESQTIDLEGNEFVRCRFIDCVLRFSGDLGNDKRIVIDNCNFSSCLFPNPGEMVDVLRERLSEVEDRLLKERAADTGGEF